MFLIENLKYALQLNPHAIARIQGDDIEGVVKMHQTNIGVIVMVEVHGLPKAIDKCGGNILGFHIHSGENCMNTLTHYNPNHCAHPYHAGDLPPLFESDGYALSVFLTNRFTVKEVIHKTIVIHEQMDDFKSQPSGNAGRMIACGQIQKGNPNK